MGVYLMNLRNFVLIFMLCCVVSAVNAVTVVIINEYKDPLKLIEEVPFSFGPRTGTGEYDPDFYKRDLGANGGSVRLQVRPGNWPGDLRLITKNGIKHSGIQRELDNLVKQVPGINKNPSALITIKILKDVDPLKLFNFKYKTTYEILPLERQDKASIAANFVQNNINSEKYLDIISKDPSYGNAYTKVNKLKQHFDYTQMLKKQGKTYKRSDSHLYPMLVKLLPDAKKDIQNCPPGNSYNSVLKRVICLIDRVYGWLLVVINQGDLPKFPTENV